MVPIGIDIVEAGNLDIDLFLGRKAEDLVSHGHIVDELDRFFLADHERINRERIDDRVLQRQERELCGYGWHVVNIGFRFYVIHGFAPGLFIEKLFNDILDLKVS